MGTFKNYRKGHLAGSKIVGNTPNSYLISWLRYFIFNDISRWYKCKILIHKATFRFHKGLYEENKKLRDILFK